MYYQIDKEGFIRYNRGHMSNSNTDLVNKIFSVLQKDYFEDWHNTRFADFITGQMQHDEKISLEESENRIKQDIAKIFGLE